MSKTCIVIPLILHLIFLFFPSTVTHPFIHAEGLCNCSSGGEGILDPDECDQRSGQCSCLPGYAGLQCEDCEEGHFTNGTSGCLPCACDSFGAVNLLCDRSGCESNTSSTPSGSHVGSGCLLSCCH